MNLSKTELYRKSIHICSCFIPFLLQLNFWLIIILLGLMLCLYITSEILRQKNIKIPVVSTVTEKACRTSEEGKFVWGPVYLVLGIIICAFAPVSHCTVGIFALAFGDGFASLIGKSFGRIKIPFTGGKTLEGSLACFTATFISLLIYLQDWLMALIFAFFTMIIEMLPLKEYDNIILPVSICGLSWLLQVFFVFLLFGL